MSDISIETLPQSVSSFDSLDDDGHLRRTGTLWTTNVRITTAMLGTIVLSLAGDIAALGWIVGPPVMFLFSFVCYYTSGLLSDCYRTGDPVSGKRNYTYVDAVRSILEILLSQIPDFDRVWWVSVVSVVMFFTYSLIGLGLAIAKIAARGSFKGRLTGISNADVTQKIWVSFEALGDIALLFSFSEILIEFQDTIRSPPPEAKTMKKATCQSSAVLTAIYVLWGCMGYAALGDATKTNLLADLAFHKPFWLLDIANAAIVINLVAAYQVYSQPIFAFVEKQAAQRWHGNEFIAKEREIPVPGLGRYKMNLFRLVWRTVFVILTTVISILFPLFNDFMEIITLGFWPLTVYFPIEMYIKQKQIPKWSTRWVCLQMLSMACLVISIMATVGSMAGLKDDHKNCQPFKMRNLKNARNLG
ncbi:hypothetical protein BT93_H3514 [Corymbia citriodora subsp. variegata]|nr:hypothetical protein BT93_H3514 [Corymbia citriodora subsp. variegata]